MWWPFKKKIVNKFIDDIRYNAGWICADTILKNAQYSVAADVITRHHTTTHSAFQKGMMDRLKQEPK